MSKEEQVKPTDDRIESKVRIYETYAKGIIIAGLVGIAIAVFALVRNGLIIPSAKFDFKLLGDFGGLIAGISGLFALGGVLLYYSALRLQAKALFLQREDIELNRKALKAQLKEFKNQVKEQQLTRKVFLEQSKTQELVRFESTFYSLYNILLNEIRNFKLSSLSGSKNGYESSERAFSEAWEDLQYLKVELSENYDLDVVDQITVYKFFDKKSSLKTICEIILKTVKLLGNIPSNIQPIYIDVFIDIIRSSLPDDLKRLLGFYTHHLKQPEFWLLEEHKLLPNPDNKKEDYKIVPNNSGEAPPPFREINW
ncbi:hypothetical protein [Peijinzhouia sedimentorum]